MSLASVRRSFANQPRTIIIQISSRLKVDLFSPYALSLAREKLRVFIVAWRFRHITPTGNGREMPHAAYDVTSRNWPVLDPVIACGREAAHVEA